MVKIELNNLFYYWQCKDNYIHKIVKTFLQLIAIVMLVGHTIFKLNKIMPDPIIVDENWKKAANKNKQVCDLKITSST